MAWPQIRSTQLDTISGWSTKPIWSTSITTDAGCKRAKSKCCLKGYASDPQMILYGRQQSLPINALIVFMVTSFHCMISCLSTGYLAGPLAYQEIFLRHSVSSVQNFRLSAGFASSRFFNIDFFEPSLSFAFSVLVALERRIALEYRCPD